MIKLILDVIVMAAASVIILTLSLFIMSVRSLMYFRTLLRSLGIFCVQETVRAYE